MEKNKGIQLGVMLAAMLILSIAFVPAVNAQGANEQKNAGIVFTSEELKSLHSKYNITENDIKFAEDKLPNFLDGTILGGNIRVVATETGKPPEGLKTGVDYDKVISIKEAIAIEEGARQGYIKKYGVDPANPKVEIINGQPLPKEKVKELVKNKKIDLDNTEDAVPSVGILSIANGPHALNGQINVIIHAAKDTAHKPKEAIINTTTNALSRFKRLSGITTIKQSWFWNYWDASDVSPAANSSRVLTDLAEDTAWMRTQDNDIVLGWAHDLDHNGVAYRDGFFALASDTRLMDVDWPHDSIVQHEVSHMFDAPEGGSWSWEHEECIMNYWYAYQGTKIWCAKDKGIVYANIWGS